jgi:hypothetical protein
MEIERFKVQGLLGEGTYSNIKLTPGKVFQAYDRKLNKEVALKVEKNAKAKHILKQEYAILKFLQSKIQI